MEWTPILVAIITVIGGIITSAITSGIFRPKKALTEIKEKINNVEVKLDRLTERTDDQDTALKEILGNFIDKNFCKFKQNNGITKKDFDILTGNYNIYKKLHGNNHRDTEYKIIETEVMLHGFIEDPSMDIPNN